MKKPLLFSIIAVMSAQAGAFLLDSGEDWNIRFDNTFKANAMVRVAKQDRDVYAASGLTGQLVDDSDLSVDRGDFASTRFDVLPELKSTHVVDVDMSKAHYFSHPSGEAIG